VGNQGEKPDFSLRYFKLFARGTKELLLKRERTPSIRGSKTEPEYYKSEKEGASGGKTGKVCEEN